ncbi:MAG: putative bifunctional diguanylate cyclase/phosphodiesterase [Acidiferrobacterales bacterium]
MPPKVNKTVLLVEFDVEGVHSAAEMFSKQGSYAFKLVHVESIEAAEAYLAVNPIDVVLLDMQIPGMHELETIRLVRRAAPRVAIVLLTDLDRESKAIIAMQGGAQDYLIKGEVEPRELMRSLSNAIERKIIEEALFKVKERAQITLDSIGDAVICTDLSGEISFLNPAAANMTGWSLPEAVGQPLADVFRVMDAYTHLTVANPVDKAVAQNRVGALPPNSLLIRRDKHELFIEDSVAPIHDREGLVVGSVLIFRDASVARALAAQMAHLSEHDSLTGLPNRLLLSDRIGQGIAQAARNKGLLAVLFLDLDGFKHINDSLGHPIGDKLLQSVAKRLEDCVRSPDTVSRQGGDEFIVLLHDVKRPEDAAITVNRILAVVEQIHTVDGHDLHITASLGVSIYPDDGVNADELIRNADTAMYRAKEGGRHGYRFFKPEMNVRAVERQSVEEDLRRALQHCEFSLHYQPKIDLKSGVICGAEALIRWKHPTRGFIPPLQFISIAEDSGLIVPIGAWVLREACLQTKAWADAGLPAISMAVNVSALQFQNDGFIDGLIAILGETGLNGKFLELEITESVLMKNAGPATSILLSLKGQGVRVSVDDFGTGYSGLSYLRKFSLDALKIDQSFVREIRKGSNDTALVTAIIAMARSLKLEVTAEGVETPEELAFLKVEGCEEAQGYLFSRPIPADQFTMLLENSMSATEMH